VFQKSEEKQNAVQALSFEVKPVNAQTEDRHLVAAVPFFSVNNRSALGKLLWSTRRGN